MNLPFVQEKPEDKILAVKYKKQIDDQLVDKLIYHIQSVTKKSSKIIIEINGTINSLTAAALFKRALGEKVMAIIFDFNPQKTQELTGICQNLSLNAYILKRAEAYYKELAAYHLHKQEAIRSFYMRFVNYHLLTTADHMKASLVDTSDKSDRLESLRPDNFYGSFMPFYSLYKTEIYDLGKFLKLPTEEINETWKKIDPILFLLVEKQLTPEQISQQCNIDLHWLKNLKSHIDKQSLKTAVSQFII